MKKRVLSLAVASTLMLVACGGEQEVEADATDATATEEVAEEVVEEEAAEEASIVGVWQCTAIDMGMEVPEEQKAAMEEAMKASIESTQYTFGDDGTMTINSQLGEQTGTYTKDGNTLNAKTGDKEESIEIGELSATTLVLMIQEEEMQGSMTFERK